MLFDKVLYGLSWVIHLIIFVVSNQTPLRLILSSTFITREAIVYMRSSIVGNIGIGKTNYPPLWVTRISSRTVVRLR